MPFINVVVAHRPDPALARTIAEGVTERTSRLLHRKVEETNLVVRFVSPADWFVGGRSVAELGMASFWFDIAVTEGVDSKTEKAAYLAEIFSFLREVLGPVHEASYARLSVAAADSWGFGGLTQEERRRRRDASASAGAGNVVQA